MTLWKKILCEIIGHEYKAITTYVGKLDTGKKVYELTYSDCGRCGEKRK